MRCLLLFLISLFSIAAGAQTCPTQRLTSPLTPKKLESFLKSSKVKKVEDVICCLPDDYQSHYVVIHSGFALQAGTPEHPRVLLYKSTPGSRGEQNLETAISFTGDDKNLNSSNHVEIMHNNNGKAELFDVDFDGNHRLSDPNPKVCMGCHAPNPTDLTNAGAKVIFTDVPWPYAVGFVSQFGARNSETSNYFAKIEKQSTHALQTQPRYACLKSNSDLSGDIIAFDQMSRDMNDKRVASLILKSPDYLRYRPLIVGARLGCINGGVWNTSTLQIFEKDFAKWIPTDVAQRIFSDGNAVGLSAKARQVQNLKSAFADFLKEAKNNELAARDKRSKQTDFKKPATFYPTSRAELFDTHISLKDVNAPELTSLKGFSPTTRLFARYALDSMTQHQIGDGIDPLFRLLFEGRGISQVSWSRAMAGDYGTSMSIPLDELKAQSASDPFWKDVGPQVDALLHTNPESGGQSLATMRKNLCDNLAKQSFRIFSSESSAPGVSSTSAPDQGTK